MSTSFRRFEILLPLRFNDGSPVPDELIADTILELRSQFGAVSSESQTIRGMWTHDIEVYRDDLVRVFVDAVDDAASRAFFVALKERLKTRFDQIDIWMTTYPIDVI
jgi:hypothetical protein